MYMTKTLDLVFQAPEHSNDHKVRISRYANSFYRKKIENLNPLVTVQKFVVTTIAEATYPVRNQSFVAYVVTFALNVEGPSSDVVNLSLKGAFIAEPIKGRSSIGEPYVLIDSIVT